MNAKGHPGRIRDTPLRKLAFVGACGDATITVIHLGDRGVELVHGVIYPPQVALDMETV